MTRDQKIEIYLKGAREFYPDLNLNSAFSLYSGDLASPSSGKIQLKHGLVDPTLINSESIQIVHYTSLNSFFEIINSETIRFYNCFNLNDPKEIEHGLKMLNFPYEKRWIDNLKRNHFILSASKYDAQLKDNFDLWRLYGQDGMGVGLVFEVPKEINSWAGINLSQIEYSSDMLTTSLPKRFLDYHQEFQSNYKLFENIPTIIPLLASFQKNEIWKIENETRIVAYCPFDKYSLKSKKGSFESDNPFLSKTLSHTINSKGDNVAFINMPISQQSIKKKLNQNTDIELQEAYLRNHPYLSLKKVILGPRLINSKQFQSIVEFIFLIASEKVGENIDIVESKFKDVYKS
ncbi:MAG: hypothetical protein RL308_116 [Bacteroidota bacterium]|jgi:hypothetical protein